MGGEEIAAMAEKIITIAGAITVAELAEKLNLSVTTLIGELFKNGIVATINQKIDIETATIILEELGISDVELRQKQTIELDGVKKAKRQLSSKAIARPPIVAVMGHVDHGKTSLLDAILKTKVAEIEAGGITQHISAYQTEYQGRLITLLDTPGHEAFAALRQHGATLTDVVVIVVAADDGVKPQTVEAIKFARSAKAKIIVAINKIDKDGADVARVKAQLATENDLNPEEWGGDTVMVEVSAKTKQGIDKLLEMILLVSDMEDIRADIDCEADGLVIEAHMETGKGAVVSLLVQNGELRDGGFVVAGTSFGKIRTMQDFRGKPLDQAGPSTPAIVTGFKNLPQFGDCFCAVNTEKEAKKMAAATRTEDERNIASTNITGSDMLKLMDKMTNSQDLNIVVKADVQGSLTSVIDSLKMINTNDEVVINIVGSGIGDISENDIRLAVDNKTIIYGFNVGISNAVKKIADRSGIQIRAFNIIYQLLDDAKQTIESMLEPDVVETDIGELEIRAVFRTTKDEIITGGQVTKGKITAGLLARVFRKKELVAEASIIGVQREKSEVKEVFEGDMCGLSLKTDNKLSLEPGDKLEIFSRELVKKKIDK